jgi:hypothetical protein
MKVKKVQTLHYRFLIGNFQFDIQKCIHPFELPTIVKNNTLECKIINLVKTPIKSVVVIANTPRTPRVVVVPANTIVMKNAKITDGFVTQLAGKDQINWDPFVCKVEKKVYNKNTKWWYLIVNDNKKSHRIVVATQCFELLKTIEKDDLIFVEYYTATTIHSKKPKIIIFTKITKIDNKN